MGPLLMAGLAVFGATIGVGLVAAATTAAPRSPTHALRQRSLAILLFAFVQGIAVLGIVVGLQGVFLGLTSVPGSGLLAAGPGLAGAVLGAAILARDRAALDPQLAQLGFLFIAGAALLSVVVALLAATIVEIGTAAPSDVPFVLTGLLSAAGAIGIATTGAAGLRSMADADAGELQPLASRVVARIVPFEALGVGATVIAILLLYL